MDPVRQRLVELFNEIDSTPPKKLTGRLRDRWVTEFYDLLATDWPEELELPQRHGPGE